MKQKQHTARQQRPTRAFILAAGFGTRMLPLSHQCPKALVPLWNKPILQHSLEMLISWGVTDVLINMHHLPNALLSFIRNYPSSIRIELSYEPTILGTGGALQKAAWFLQDDHFWMVNADVAAELDPSPMIALHRASKALATLWLHADKGPRTVEMADNSIHSFRSKHAGTPGTYTFCGLQLLSPQILSFLPKEGFSSIIVGYEKAQKKGHRISGTTIPDSYWADIGTPQQYLTTHEEIQTAYKQHLPGQCLYDPSANKTKQKLKKKNIHIEGFAAVDSTTEITGPAHISNSVIWPHVTIKRNARLSNCIAGQHITARGSCEHIIVPARMALSKAEIHALEQINISPIKDATCIQLPARGSARSFFRICNHHHKAILIRYSPERKENERYAKHTRLLQSIGCHVPTIYHEDHKNTFMLMEDIGTDSVEMWIQGKSQTAVKRTYQKVIDQIALMHTQGLQAVKCKRIPLMPSFDSKLYQWEHELFITHFLPETIIQNKATILELRKELTTLTKKLTQVSPVLIHRDLQSSNLYRYKKDIYFIDYQGMRQGAAAYDLASLLCDPYVMLPDTLKKDLLAYYIDATGDQNVHIYFWYAAIQRLLQALGAYGRLSKLPGAERFKVYIPGAERQTSEALKYIPEPFPVLSTLIT